MSAYLFLKEQLTFRQIFLILLLVFIVSRFVAVFAFPIFNDEGLYVQFSQAIAMDFRTYYPLSMHNIFGTWKPPLQYVLGSVFVPFGDPVISGRMLSVLVSILGFCGLWFFVKELYGRRESVITSLLYILSAPVLMYNSQFIAETYVFSTAAFLYWCALLMVRSREQKRVVFFGFLSILLGTALILFKQSGALYLFLLPLLAFIQEKRAFSLFKSLVLLVGVILGAEILYRIIIPSSLLQGDALFTNEWSMGLRDIIGLPFGIWWANIKNVFEFYSRYYTFAVIPILCTFFFQAISTKKSTDKVIAVLFLSASLAIIFCLRFFSEYIYNTAVIIFMIPALARGLLFFSQKYLREKSIWTQPLVLCGIFLGGCLFLLWGYKFMLLEVRPVQYLESGTTWTQVNYLTGWSTGYGIQPIVDLLKKQKEPAVLFVDPQWGNPGTALQVYNAYYPQVMVSPLLPDFLSVFTAKDIMARYQKHFVVFSDRSLLGPPPEWVSIVETSYCKERREFREYPTQVPIIMCAF